MGKKFFVPRGFLNGRFFNNMLDNAIFLTIVFSSRQGIRSIPYTTFMSIARVGRNSVAASLKRLKRGGWVSYSVGKGRVNRFRFFYSPAQVFKNDLNSIDFSQVEVSRAVREDFLEPAVDVIVRKKGKGKGKVNRITFRSKMAFACLCPNMSVNKYHRKGQVSYGPEMTSLARDLGKSERSVRRYLDILNGASLICRERRKMQQNKYTYVTSWERFIIKERRKGEKKGRKRRFCKDNRETSKNKDHILPAKKTCTTRKPDGFENNSAKTEYKRKRLLSDDEGRYRMDAVLDQLVPPPLSYPKLKS